MAGEHSTIYDSEAQPATGLPPSAGQRWPALLHALLRAAFDVVFPPCCAACGRADVAWCAECQATLQALPLTLHTRLLDAELPAASTSLHTGILQQAIHALKYHNVPWPVPTLAARLNAALNALSWPVEALIPIPMHPRKRAERGYNQAELLTEALAQRCGLSHWPHALARTRDTRSQVGLGQGERAANVADAFAGDAALLAGRSVLLVDDVLTTGATLLGCAQAARGAGARVVYCLTLSVASL